MNEINLKCQKNIICEFKDESICCDTCKDRILCINRCTTHCRGEINMEDDVLRVIKGSVEGKYLIIGQNKMLDSDFIEEAYKLLQEQIKADIGLK